MNRISLVLKELILGILIYGIIALLIGLLFTPNASTYTVGLLIGLLTAVGMAVHMERAMSTALDLGPGGAEQHIRKTYLIRTLIVILIFGLAVYFRVGSVWSLFIGVMGLKVAAYIQPLIEKLPFIKKQSLSGQEEPETLLGGSDDTDD